MDNNKQIIAVIKDSINGVFSDEVCEVRVMNHLMNAFREIQKLHGDEQPLWSEWILKRILDRMKLGQERYGHGVRVSDDTRQWGTIKNSWAEMCEEEIIDGVIYISASMIRNYFN